MNTTAFMNVPTSIDEALQDTVIIRDRLLTEANSLDFPAPPSGKWSLEENLYHIHLVERGSASAIRRMIEGEKHERFSDETVKKTWERMKKMVLDRSRTLPAPDGFAPKDTPSRADCIRLLGESHERLLLHCSKTTADDLLRTGFPHPVIGQIPGLLWITFIALHEARHLAQILELKQPSKA